ncbi:hypothetical protein ACIRVF_38655 [Kitasatospora sp. NPDC101157]|uniref:hypothetical protein n=1 Tax=Kitasatospora sp. NPDC101157 TaxID=3364098 RepID=UPI0038100C31
MPAAHPTLPLPPPAMDVDVLRQTLASEIRGTGVPPREALPAAPIALPREVYAELFRAARSLLDLLRRTALEVAATTEGRLEAFGVSPEDYPLFCDDPVLEERYAACMARPDIVIGANGPRFLEFNVSGAVGGAVELHCLYRAWHELYRRTEDSPPFGFDDPFAGRADLFTDVCTELSLPPRLVWVGSTRDLKHTDSTRYFDLEMAYLNRRGFDARFLEPEDLHTAWDAPEAERRLLGLRHFTVPEWRDLGIDSGPVKDALRHGCLLLAPQTSSFLANKQCLGLLSEGRPWMSEAERSVVSRYLPWTRVLGNRPTDHHGRRIDLLKHTVEHREDLVLKAGIGMQGLQVLIGRDTDPAMWQARVEEAAEAGGSIVQEHVTGVAVPVFSTPAPGAAPEVTNVVPVFSPFLFGNHASGVWARYRADGGEGIVSREGYGAMENAVVVC